MNRILNRIAYIRKTDTVLDDYTIKTFCQKYKISKNKFHEALKQAINIQLKLLADDLTIAQKAMSRIIDQKIPNINELTNKYTFDELTDEVKKVFSNKVPFKIILSSFDTTRGLDNIIRIMAQIITYSRGFSVSSRRTKFGREVFNYIENHSDLVNPFYNFFNYMLDHNRWYSVELYSGGETAKNKNEQSQIDEKYKKLRNKRTKNVFDPITNKVETELNKKEYFKNKENGRLSIDELSNYPDKLGQDLEINNTFTANSYDRKAFAIINGQLYTNKSNPFAYKNTWLNGKSITDATYVIGYITDDNNCAIIVETQKLSAGVSLAALIKSKLNVKKVYNYTTVYDTPEATLRRLATK